jgi:hypothetical protein
VRRPNAWVVPDAPVASIAWVAPNAVGRLGSSVTWPGERLGHVSVSAFRVFGYYERVL